MIVTKPQILKIMSTESVFFLTLKIPYSTYSTAQTVRIQQTKRQLGDVRFQYITQNGVPFKIYKVFMYGIFQVNIFGHQMTMDERKQEKREDHKQTGRCPPFILLSLRPPPFFLLYLEAPEMQLLESTGLHIAATQSLRTAEPTNAMMCRR